jgi:hypothetical protein
MADEPLSIADWRRALRATELGFVSSEFGAGLTWATASGLPDEHTITTLRGVQAKLLKLLLSTPERSDDQKDPSPERPALEPTTQYIEQLARDYWAADRAIRRVSKDRSERTRVYVGDLSYVKEAVEEMMRDEAQRDRLVLAIIAARSPSDDISSTTSRFRNLVSRAMREGDVDIAGRLAELGLSESVVAMIDQWSKSFRK